MLTVFEYSDFRKFVAEKVEFLKVQNPALSIRKRLKSNGITNPSFILSITKYRKNINAVSAKKMAAFLALNGIETTFFLKLVEFNQETDLSKKKDLARQLMRHSGIKKHAPLVLDKYEYFANWINIVVYESISPGGTNLNISELSKKFRGMASVADISGSVDLLKRLGLVEERNNRIWQLQKSILSDDEISWAFSASHYEAFFRVGLHSMENDPVQLREFSSLTFSFPKKKAKQLKDIILNFRNEIIDVISDAEEGDEVFQIMLQLYPVTKTPPKT